MNATAELRSHLFCTSCGTRNEVAWNPDCSNLRDCTGCGVRPVDIMTLLWEVSIGTHDYTTCESCSHKNSGDPFCYYCGKRYGQAPKA